MHLIYQNSLTCSLSTALEPWLGHIWDPKCTWEFKDFVFGKQARRISVLC